MFIPSVRNSKSNRICHSASSESVRICNSGRWPYQTLCRFEASGQSTWFFPTFLKSAKRTDPDSSQNASHRGESSRPNTLVSATVGLIPASLRHDMISDAAYLHDFA
jgi:hypothetical protein